MYYLQSRYYDPAIGRFINADTFATTDSEDFLSGNMFAYCENDPVNHIDSSGEIIDTVFDVVSLGFSVVDVINNPSDPWAWIGLACDVIDVAVPLVSGIGESVRAVNSARKTIKSAEKAKTGWKIGDDISALSKAGNAPSWSTIRSRFWNNQSLNPKNRYLQVEGNLERMRKGRAPLVKHANGSLFPMELHHPRGRVGQNIYYFVPVTPWKHAAIDPYRHFVV